MVMRKEYVLSLLVISFIVISSSWFLIRDVSAQSSSSEIFSYPLSFPVETVAQDKLNSFIGKRRFLLENETLKILINGRLPIPSEIQDGALSPDRKLVAYTVKDPVGWGIEPFVYIYDVKKQINIDQIPLSDSTVDKFVASWSKNSKYIFVVTKAQSLGAVDGEVYSINSKKRVEKIEMYDFNHSWGQNDEITYIYGEKDCAGNCIIKGVNLKKFGISDRKEVLLDKYDFKEGDMTPFNEEFIKSSIKSLNFTRN